MITINAIIKTLLKILIEAKKDPCWNTRSKMEIKN